MGSPACQVDRVIASVAGLAVPTHQGEDINGQSYANQEATSIASLGYAARVIHDWAWRATGPGCRRRYLNPVERPVCPG